MRLDLSVTDAEVSQDGVDLYWGIEVEEPQSEQVTCWCFIVSSFHQCDVVCVKLSLHSIYPETVG